MIARSMKAKLLVFAIFFVGIATGILIANFYTMRVTAHDGAQEIGRGTVGRAVVHVPSFLARMREKARK